MTRLAACMRGHGYPTFPDPNGQGLLVLNNIDPSSAQFQSAMKTCQTLAKYTGPLEINATSSGPAQPPGK